MKIKEMESFSSYDHPSSCTLASSNGKEKKGGGRRGKTAKLSTDAQSVAARERRHRISERFKILQGLVPGGSKMDTVSMLEEAIHYVKFLKAQIWLHQTMIINNCVDINSSTHPSSFPPTDHHLPTKPADDGNLYAQVNMAAGEVQSFSANSWEPARFLYSDSPQLEHNVTLDATLLY